MDKEQELPLDPAYTDGPYSVIPMPINAHGTGPEMDPAKVQNTLYEVWNGHCLSLGQWPSRALAQFVADALNRRSPDEQAEVVGYVDRLSGPTRISATEQPELEVPVYASPPAVAKGGVTEDMVERAARAEYTRVILPGVMPEFRQRDLDANWRFYEAEARRWLTAALAVGDEGIREEEAEPFLTGRGWENLSCDDQFTLATQIAANIGYDLVPEPEHPDSPHNRAHALPIPPSRGEGE